MPAQSKPLKKTAAGIKGVEKVINRLQVVDRLPPRTADSLELIR
ncbi:MAG TPA: hypothetical protein PKD12_09965 [Nitrospira sp.]|nr:hypothetical protein [Nitrospira sp.]